MISPYAGIFDQSLLFYVLSSAFAHKQFSDKVAGAVVQNLNSDKVADSFVPLPPLAEQHRIVAKIEELLPKVEEYGKAQDELNKLNEELPERLKKSILQEAIEGRLVPQDPNDEPASVLLDKIRKEKEQLVKEGKLKKKDLIETPITEEEIPFEIPDSWEWVRLGHLINLLSGRDLSPTEYNKSNNGIPYMTGASNFESGILIVNRWTNHPATISHKGDLLITCKGTIGEMAFNTIGDLHVARQIMAINSHSLNLNYVRFFLMRIVSELENKAKSIIPGISRDDILNASFPLPPLAEQHRIVEKLEQLLGEIDKLKV
jgi:type I restriction enzyme S subunit